MQLKMMLKQALAIQSYQWMAYRYMRCSKGLTNADVGLQNVMISSFVCISIMITLFSAFSARSTHVAWRH